MTARITILHRSDSAFVPESHTAAANLSPQPARRPPIRLEPRPSWWWGLLLPVLGAASGVIALLPLAAALGSGWWLFVPAAYGFIIGCLFHE